MKKYPINKKIGWICMGTALSLTIYFIDPKWTPIAAYLREAWDEGVLKVVLVLAIIIAGCGAFSMKS